MTVLSKQAVDQVVYINGRERFSAKILQISQFMKSMLHTAVVELIPPVGTSDNELIPQGFNLASAFSNSVMEIQTSFAGGGFTTLFRGKVSGGRAGFDPSTSSIVIEGRLDEYLFGEPLELINNATFTGTNPNQRSKPGSWTKSGVNFPLVFNPVFDGRVFGNEFNDSVLTAHCFIHPDSIPFRVTNLNKRWSLRSAARFLCQWLNTNQLYVFNPRSFDFNVLPDDEDVLVDMKIAYGTFLPSALDKLLEPYGYFAKAEFLLGNRKPTIQFQKRGGNERIILKGQKFGEDLDLAKSQVSSIGLSFDMINESASSIVALGARPRFEETFELYPGWASTHDDKFREMDELKLDSEFSQTVLNGHRVWRDWVLNENGDYNEDRGLKTWQPTAENDVSPYFAVDRRRQFLEVLSSNNEGTSAGIHDGVYVEYSVDGGTTWKAISGGWDGGETDDYAALSNPSIKVLEKEAGIRFTGIIPPPQLVALGVEERKVSGTTVTLPVARIRVTACLEADIKISHYTPTNSLINAADVEKPLIIDASDRYRFDKVLSTSQFQTLIGTVISSREIDQRVPLITFANELASGWGHASVSGPVELFGVGDVRLTLSSGNTRHAARCLGLDVSKISGRDLNFQIDTAGSSYPTIEGITHDFQNHSTRLEFKTYRGGLI